MTAEVTGPAVAQVAETVPAAGMAPAGVHVVVIVPGAGTARLPVVGPWTETAHAGSDQTIPTGLVGAAWAGREALGQRSFAGALAAIARRAAQAVDPVRTGGTLGPLVTSGVRYRGERLAHRRRTARSIR